MKKINKKYLSFILILLLSVSQLTACNNQNGENPDAANEASNPENTPAEEPANEGNDAASAENPAPASNEPAVSEPPANTPVAERSPVEVTRIEPDTPQYSAPTVTGAGTDSANDTAAPSETEETSDPHQHEPLPNLFPIDKCQVEINGVYDSKFSKELVDAINAARVDYMINPVARNTSLLACADIRCKEQSYFIGHFRPDGSSWQTVAPGYVQGECIAVDYRKAADVVEAWLAVNDTRVQLMNPDYTQIGTSVYNINGNLYIAAEFGW